MKTSRIPWTGATWNPWQGCRKKSQGCKNCYMFRDMKRYGRSPTDIRRSKPGTFDAPLNMQREAERGDRVGTDRLVFTCSWSDWYLREANPWRRDAWAIIRECPLLTFQILTKRVEAIEHETPWIESREGLPLLNEEPWPNVWLGASAEDQQTFNARRGYLHPAIASVVFWSLEPLLGPIDLSGPQVANWIIVGGESGNRTGEFQARGCNVGSIRLVVRQARALGVPCFVKQLGTFPYIDRAGGSDRPLMMRPRDPHGEDPAEWPSDLRVRQFPKGFKATAKS